MLMIVLVASRPPAIYNLLLITPKANPPAGCGNGSVPVRSCHVLATGSYAYVLGCALVTCPVLYPLMMYIFPVAGMKPPAAKLRTSGMFGPVVHALAAIS